MSRKSDKPKPVSVYVRCRPRNSAEKAAASPSIVDCTKREVVVRQNTSNINKKYTFDTVYGPNSSQVDLYKGVAASTIEEVLQGYNCTIFAYGQTGTGKTYTMEGERSLASNIPWEKDPQIGLIPRSMSHMFDRLNAQASDYSVRVSMLELYNEELFDLLSPPNSSNVKLRLFEDSARKVTRGIGSVVIQGLEEVQVMSKDEVHGLMERAMQKRQTAATNLNAHSSRSHVVFTVTVHIKTVSQDDLGECEEEVFKMGKLNLVDLAGSENIGRSGAQNARAREAGNINQSLLTLGRVITALVDRAPHVPYRESKLTRLLQDSLGGRTQTSIVATISPAHCNLEETLSTLDYANRAKSILNKPEVNQRSSKKALIKEYTAEIEKLKKDLQNVREKSGVYLDLEKFNEMEQRMRSQSQLIKDKEDELSALLEARSKISNLFSYSIKQIDGLHKKIDRKATVEAENKHVINNFIQNTKNQYAMFGEIMSQHRQQLQQENTTMNEILEKIKIKDSEALRNTSSTLNDLMKTVVEGLNTTIQHRDSQHDSWITGFFSNQLIPAVNKAISNIDELKEENQAATQSATELLSKEQNELGKKLCDMQEAIQYMISSGESECMKLMDTIQHIQGYKATIEQEKAAALEASRATTAAAVEAIQQASVLLQNNQAHLARLEEIERKSASQLLEKDRELHERAEELALSLKHGSDSVVEGHLKLLKDQTANLDNVKKQVKLKSAGSLRKFTELRDTCQEIENTAKRTKTEYSAQIVSSAENVCAAHATLLSDGEDSVAQVAHLRKIFDSRCRCDVVTLEYHNDKDELLREIQQETSGLLHSSNETCTQSSGLIKEADTSLQNLKTHVKEDLPTGTTPKRAKLNRLMLHQNSGFNLDIIESDEENADPNPVLDMSY